MANLCMHADSDSIRTMSDSSPDEATRLIGPEAHMMAWTNSCRLLPFSLLPQTLFAVSRFIRACACMQTVTVPGQCQIPPQMRPRV